MKLPATPISRWALNSQGDVYRLDGYVGIGTDSPGGLLGLGDSTTYITVDSTTGEITFSDAVNGVRTLSQLGGGGIPNLLLEVQDAVITILKDLDGYASDITESEHYLQLSQINQSIMQALNDAYSAAVTKEALTFSVDYNLAGAVDIPAGTVFTKQAQIDGYLADAGTTAFKYFQDAWNTLPGTVAHNAIFNLAAGVHRPRSPESNTAAWTLLGRTTIAPATITIQGASSANYTIVVPSSTITAVQAASNDPYVDADYPYAVDGYRGLFAIFDTGQVTVIHDNTASRLSVTNNISPVSPTSVIVARPGTILRNSYDDFNRVKSTGISVGSGNLSPCRVIFSDIQLDAFNPTFAFTTALGSIVTLTRFLIDHAYVKDTFGVSDSGRAFQPSDIFSATASSLRGTNIATVPTTASGDALFSSAAGKSMGFSNSYIGGFRRISMGGATTTAPGLNLSSVIFDKMWQYGLFLQNGCHIFAQHNVAGPYTTFRDCNNGIYMQRNCHFSPGTTQTVDIKFEGTVSTFCLLLEQGCSCIIEGGIGLQNGATSNTGVGIQLSGPHNRTILNSSTNVSGTLGEVQFADNSIRLYNDIRDFGPYIDTSLNYAQKS